ncbi:unnamed protein product, partial [Symbiodinium pilosum]
LRCSAASEGLVLEKRAATALSERTAEAATGGAMRAGMVVAKVMTGIGTTTQDTIFGAVDGARAMATKALRRAKASRAILARARMPETAPRTWKAKAAKVPRPVL